MVDPEKVRFYLRDHAELNFLLNETEQFSDEEIEIFDVDVRDELVLQIPALIAQKDNIHDIIVTYGIIGKLLEAEAQRENRNQMTIGDDNVGQIDYSNKADKYFSIASSYNQKALQLAQNMAASSFYRDTWGDVGLASSDYELFFGSD